MSIHLRRSRQKIAESSLHVVEVGEPDGQPFLFLHGWPESWQTWEGVFAAAHPDVRLIAVDLPGIGESTGAVPGGTKLRLAQVIHELVLRLELADLTRPGPFGLRTIELGEYFGCFEAERLVAMAGERMHAGKLREISGVSTHPDFQGRGLARRLMVKLIRRQMQREELPFLHVMSDNKNAHRLYERMGFRDYRESLVRVISQC